MSLKSEVVTAGGQVTAERLLLELSRKFAESNEFGLTPRRASQVIASVLAEVDEARAYLATQAPKPKAK
jgi:hypothetical protein